MATARFALLLIALALLPAPASARIPPTPWEELLRASDLIVVARLVRGEAGEHAGGRATFEVTRAVRGTHTGAFELAWISEDEQPLDQLGGRYLLFLRRTQEGLVPASFGVSAWWIQRLVADGREVVAYHHPVSKVVVPPGFVTEVEDRDDCWGSPPWEQPVKRRVIPLDVLLEAIAKAS